MNRLFAASLLLSLASFGFAAEEHAHQPASTPHLQTIDTEPHPTLSPNPAWTRTLVLTIAALFAAAALIGLIVRANTPQPTPADHTPDTHAHAHAAHH